MEGSRPPYAAGLRLDWPEVPGRVRAAVEDWLGSPVVSAASQSAGFSPGVAARLQTEDGRRVFAKAAGPEPNPLTPVAHRREARITSALPVEVPVPRLLWSHARVGLPTLRKFQAAQGELARGSLARRTGWG